MLSTEIQSAAASMPPDGKSPVSEESLPRDLLLLLPSFVDRQIAERARCAPDAKSACSPLSIHEPIHKVMPTIKEMAPSKDVKPALVLFACSFVPSSCTTCAMIVKPRRTMGRPRI